MKAFLLFISLSAIASAQDMREPQRVVNSTRADLQPLFTWWTNADVICKSNLHLSIKKKIPLPVRVLPAWIRITTSDITNTGRYWIGTAQIQTAPGSRATNQMIALRNGPFTEKQKVDAAAARFEQATAERNGQINAAFANASHAKALGNRGSQYQEIRNAGGSRTFGNLANDYKASARAASANASANRNRADALDAERERLSKITRGRPSMTVDTFGLRTGETYAGLPVYDMGLPSGR